MTRLPLLLVLMCSMPVAASAYSSAQEVVSELRMDLSIFPAVGIGLAMAIFIMGMASFIANSGNEQSHQKGRKQMVWGLVALFFMVSVWGIVNILQFMFAPDSFQECSPTEIDIAGGQGIVEACI